MKRALGLVFVVALVATPAMAQKVNIDYSHEFDFSKVKTFEYVDTKESDSKDPLMDQRIQGLIEQKLKDGGLTEVSENPDIYVTYHITTKDQTSYTTTNFGYGGMWGGWYGWGGGMGTSYTTPVNYTEGTLIVDAYDATDKKMVWRGVGTVTVKAKPEKVTQQIQNILDKLGKRWAKILKGQGK